MEPPSVIQSDPFAMLLREIEILFAQAQLIEIYLRQVRAAASSQAAQLHYHYQSELTSLWTELEQKARALAVTRQGWGVGQERLQGQFQQLTAEIAEKQRIIDHGESERGQIDAEIDSLRARIGQLESANEDSAARAQEAERGRDSLRNELVALGDLLREKSREIEQRQEAARQFERELNDQIRQLERRLAENRTLLEAKDTALQRANAEIAQLGERSAVLETSRAEAHANAARELEQARDGFEAQLAELQTALGEKDSALNACHATMAGIQSGVQVQIHDLKNQLDQKQALLESRDGELAELRARIGGLDQANQEALAAASEFAAVRQNYETEIQELRSQLRRNQEILEENQAAARALEESRQVEIRELKDRLDQEHGLLETGEHELRNARTHITGLQQQIHKLEATAGELQQAAQHQLEQARVGFEAQLTGLRDLLAQKEQALQERAATITEIDRDLRAQIGDLESQLARQQALLAGRDRELAELRSELDAKERSLADQRASLTALEAEHRAMSETLEARLTQSRELVASKDSELERVRSEHAALRNQIAERHAAEIVVLSARLSEGQSLLDHRASELQQAHAEIAALREQAAQIELLQKQTEHLLSAQAEQIRDRVRSELAAVEACLKQKERELQTEKDSAAESQVRLHGKIERLQIELAEKPLLLAERDHEISDLKEQSRNLIERLAQLESSNQQAQADAAAALERNREVQQAELTALREELHTKVEALAEQQISANGLEAKLLAQITGLQEQLADASRVLESREESLNTAQMEFSARLEQKDQAFGVIQSRATELETTLNSKIQELQARLVEEEARANERQRRQEAQRTELQEQLGATQRQLEEGQQAFDSANATAGALQERLARLEACNREAQAVANETDSKREALESALANLRNEMQEKERALAERQATIESLTQTHKNEIQTLETKLAGLRRAEAQEKHQTFERRTEKLLRVEAATNSRPERLGRPEKVSQAADGRAQGRESPAVPRQSAVNSLASEQVVPDNRKENALVSREPKASASQKERFDKLKDLVEKVQTEESPAFPAHVSWHWRYFGRWKRRQKT